MEDLVTLLSHLSGMYKWIVDGISSLFEPISGQSPQDLAGKSIDSEEEFTRTCVKTAARRLGNSARPAKRNYQRSVNVNKCVNVLNNRLVFGYKTAYVFVNSQRK